jgi:LysR family transcriptional activator of nhaA
VTSAAEEMRLSPPTISAQLRSLEESLGQRLFARSGRRLILTEPGRLVLSYADEIFSLGQELRGALRERPLGRPLRLVVGLADVLPKLIAHRLIQPAMELREPVRVVCREDNPDHLLAELAVHNLDVVLSDAPMNPGVRVRAYNHLLGECGVTFLGGRKYATSLRRGFPRSLNNAPLLLPTDNTALRRDLDAWFEKIGIHPAVVGEFEDNSLLRVFGEAGVGIFPAPSAVEKQLVGQYRLHTIGRTRGVRCRFYAISVEKKIHHPAVVAICERARRELFAGETALRVPGRKPTSARTRRRPSMELEHPPGGS